MDAARSPPIGRRWSNSSRDGNWRTRRRTYGSMLRDRSPRWLAGCSNGSTSDSMKYLVISDVHANLEALEATLAKAGPHDATLVLGDLVGYGADPNAVIDRIRQLPGTTIIRGNHDKVGAGIENVEAFNHLAKQAITWTASELTPGNRAWLAALPAGPVCIFGHTHVPAVYKQDTDFHPVGPPRGERFSLLLDGAAKYLVNCGAVGQPRDGDARAAFGMLDTATGSLTVIRTPY